MPKSISFLTPAFWGWADVKSSLRRSVDVVAGVSSGRAVAVT